jgi:hypothetical protein
MKRTPRVAIGLGAWLFACVIAGGVAAAIAFESSRTAEWSRPFYEARIVAAALACVGSIALVTPADAVTRRWVPSVAAVAWALSASCVYAFAPLWRAARVDSSNGRDVTTAATVALGVMLVGWLSNAVGGVLMAIVIAGFAKHVGRTKLAHAALASALPFLVAVGVKLSMEASSGSSLAFGACAVLAYGTLAFVAHRILFAGTAPIDE